MPTPRRRKGSGGGLRAVPNREHESVDANETENTLRRQLKAFAQLTTRSLGETDLDALMTDRQRTGDKRGQIRFRRPRERRDHSRLPAARRGMAAVDSGQRHRARARPSNPLGKILRQPTAGDAGCAHQRRPGHDHRGTWHVGVSVTRRSGLIQEGKMRRPHQLPGVQITQTPRP